MNIVTPLRKCPRRPLSPYIFFSQEKRKDLKHNHPEWNSRQIMKQVSIIWSRMDLEKKTEYQELSHKDRDRYEIERIEFTRQKPVMLYNDSILTMVHNRK